MSNASALPPSATATATATAAPAAPVAPYAPLRPARDEIRTLRGLRQRSHAWGDASLATAARPTMVMVHGWMDVGASFQFMVDALCRREGPARHVVAHDWRGFGASDGGGVDSFTFVDYVGDLDALIDAVSPDAPVDLVGHSMGGNVAMSYAGARPGRVRRLVNLEGFGLPESPPESAPERLAKWLDELKEPATMRSYVNVEQVAHRLRQTNPRLSPDKAAWLAPRWSEQRADGRWHILGDPAHKRTNPIPYRKDEALACWRRIAAPVLWVEGAETDVTKWWGDRYPRSEFEARLAQVPRVERMLLADCGHMLHHDRPDEVAERLLAFLAG
jgi:pimeloyl-ACP methyl ester carboxylesterase